MWAMKVTVTLSPEQWEIFVFPKAVWSDCSYLHRSRESLSESPSAPEVSLLNYSTEGEPAWKWSGMNDTNIKKNLTLGYWSMVPGAEKTIFSPELHYDPPPRPGPQGIDSETEISCSFLRLVLGNSIHWDVRTGLDRGWASPELGWPFRSITHEGRGAGLCTPAEEGCRGEGEESWARSSLTASGSRGGFQPPASSIAGHGECLLHTGPDGRCFQVFGPYNLCWNYRPHHRGRKEAIRAV